MNEEKICFIIYCDNRMNYSDNLEYIRGLNVPKDIQVECLSIENNRTKFAAFNEGMYASDAKYKVYISSNDYIINKNFIYDILKIFETDDKIAIVGTVGRKGSFSEDLEAMEYGKKMIDSLEYGINMKEYCAIDNAIEEVDSIDDTLIATAYDFPWEEDMELVLDSHITAHCERLKHEGYKTVVAKQDEPWLFKETILA